MQYHRTSCAAFAAYAAANAMTSKGKELEVCLGALERMYMNPKGESSALVQHVFEICHDIDLLRCYTATKMEPKRQKIADVIGGSAEFLLMTAAEQAVRATGGRIMYSPTSGDTQQYECALFREHSLNPRQCLATVRAVLRQAFTPPTFKDSNFKRLYEASDTPTYQHEFMGSLQLFLKECCEHMDLETSEMHEMFASLQKEVMQHTEEVMLTPRMLCV